MSLTEKQQAIRRSGVGSSEIAAVAGLSRYATALDVWQRKQPGAQDVEETRPMKRGRILEPALADWYAEDVGVPLVMGETTRHPRIPIAIATPDRIATPESGRYVVELKTAGRFMAAEWGEPGTDDVPQEYLCQVQWEMGVTELQRADLAVLISGDDFRIYTIAFDPEFFLMLVDQASRFWVDHIESAVPPPVDGSESAAQWLAQRYPKDNGLTVPSTPEIEALVREYRKAAAEASVASARRDEAKNRIKAAMGEATKLMGDGWWVRWSQVKGRETTDWKAVCAEAGVPEALVKKHTARRAGHRQFRPSWAKESSDE